MAPAKALWLSLFLLSLHCTSAQRENSSSIKMGSSLYANAENNSWRSPSGHFAFGFYPQGNELFAVGIWLVNNPDDTTVVWTANRDDPLVPSNSKLEFSKDGLLLLRKGQDELLKPVVELSERGTSVSASMMDSGNFVIYNNDFEVIWQSFEHPTDTLLGGQSISSWLYSSKLFSSKSGTDHSSGRFYVEVNGYGDLDAYPVNHTDGGNYWEVRNPGSDSSTELYLTRGGVLQLRRLDRSIQIIANNSYSDINYETVIYRATLDSDGILRFYSHRFKANGLSNVNIESSALQNRCEVKGFCGYNSYCSGNTTKADCHCFTGFDFIDTDMKFLGCYRSFNDEEGCERKNPGLFYNITAFKNTRLGGDPYARPSVNYKEDCSKSCLDDCYCGAALYMNGTCSRFRLPLMFGVEDKNESATLFVKWSSGIVNIDNTQTILDKNLIKILAASFGFATFLCFLMAVSSFLVYKLRVNRYRKLPGNSSLGLREEFIAQSFTYNELYQATDGFREELGKGRFGAVYKGSISEGQRLIAVKQLERPGEDGERKFRAEMAAVRRTHHRNVVRLLGFCMEGSRKLLVYEYMGKGSLADLLFNVERHPLWKERVRIALDLARGILYLHEECEVQMVHSNINPRTILMDDYWTAKISNFSSAKLLMPNQTETISVVGGTIGHVAPEWQKNALISVKSDVYSFGIVLLEIVCCRSNMEVNVSTADEVLLSTWVYKCFVMGELNKLVEEEEVDMKSLERMVKVGLLCIQDDPSLRPSMKSVILMLEGTMDVPVTQNPSSLVIT